MDRAEAKRLENQLTAEILERAKRIHDLRQEVDLPFEPGRTRIGYAGRVYGHAEITNLLESALEFWLTAGIWHRKLEKKLAAWYGVEHARLVNSGSSANLLAATALASPTWGERRLKPGDEVITVAGGFPTTVAPLIQNGAVPVFIDLEPRTYNIRPDLLEAARSSRTKAVMVAHTLGNPFDLGAVTAFCRKHGLWLVEDNCDAAGALYDGRKTGTFGDLATLSFYPPHHMTTGEGGAVLANTDEMNRVLESIRDWGRDCWCPPGADNTCGKRFEWQLGELPLGYDHKYIYTHLGYNLKMTDLQASVGVAQINRLDGFVRARRDNWAFYRNALADLEDVLILPEPTPRSEPSWFGFLMQVRETAPFTRDGLAAHLEAAKVQTRMLFAGNLTRQPALTELVRLAEAEGRPAPYRVVGELRETDRVMERGLWVGVYPGLTAPMREYVAAEIRRFVREPGRKLPVR